MTSRAHRTPLPARLAKPLVYGVGMVPAAWTFYLALNDRLGADPLKVLERSLGLWSLRFLVLGLAVTPLVRLGGPNLIRYRRAIGLLAFYYAALHVTVQRFPGAPETEYIAVVQVVPLVHVPPALQAS